MLLAVLQERSLSQGSISKPPCCIASSSDITQDNSEGETPRKHMASLWLGGECLITLWPGTMEDVALQAV